MPAAKAKKFSKTFIVGPFKMAFPHLLSPEKDPTTGVEKFKMTMLFEPGSKSIRQIEDALYEAMEDGFGHEDEWPTGRNVTTPEAKLYDAGTKSKYTGFIKGWRALAASSKDAPGVVDSTGEEVLNAREIYGGRWARAQVTITSFDNQSKGVTAYLNHVQLLEHDEPFSGKGNAKDVFTNDGDDDDRGNRRSNDAVRGSTPRDDGRRTNAREEDSGRGENRGAGGSRNRDREITSDEEEKGGTRRETRDSRDDSRSSRPSSRSTVREDDDGDDRSNSSRPSRGGSRPSNDEWN